MSSPFDPVRLEIYPTVSGVYLMKDKTGQVLYVGKAKNLKNRLRSYFSASDTRAQIPYLLAKTHDIETIVVYSEKEALLLENTLIKKYQPQYNVLLKDDKGYISLKMSTKHPFPRLELVRFKGAPPKGATYFGPYTSAHDARELFDFIGRLFPLRQCSDEEFARRVRPCMLYQIKRCSAPCVGYVTQEQYREYVQDATLLLKGQNQLVVKNIEKEMHDASDKLEFEKAHALFAKKQLLVKMTEHALSDRYTTKETDAWALYRQGGDVIICKLLVRGEKLAGSHHFDFTECVQETGELLSSFLVQHYFSEPISVQEVLLYENIEEMQALSEIFTEQCGKKIEVKRPEIGDKKKLVELAHKNAEALFKQRKNLQTIREKALLELQERLTLLSYPKRIECFDNSHLSGSEQVSAVICFVDGQKEKSLYRKYKMRASGTSDDYAMMREVLTRHLNQAKQKESLPDLLVIDGGKGHLQIAREVLDTLEIISCDVIALAKEKHRHDKGLTLERVFTIHSKEPVILDPYSPTLFLLQNIRDEAHRFVLNFQTDRRKKSTIKSKLDDIVGIGPMKKKALIRAFGSVRAICEKSKEELQTVRGINAKDAATIYEFFKGSQGSLQ